MDQWTSGVGTTVRPEAIHCRIAISAEQVVSRIRPYGLPMARKMAKRPDVSLKVSFIHNAPPLLDHWSRFCNILHLRRVSGPDHWTTGPLVEFFFPYRIESFDKRHSQQCVMLSSSFFIF